MNAELKGKSKNDFEKDFIKLMNNSEFEKVYGECKEGSRHQTCDN